MIYYARIDGEEKKIRIEKRDDFYDVTINDVLYHVDPKYLENVQSLSLLINSRCYEASIAEIEGSTLVTIGGEKFQVDLTDELIYLAGTPSLAHGSSDTEVIKTPMPGVVVAIEVEPGQKIAPGSPVAIVEAMKMQNEISSVCGGIVKEILVRRGDTVESNQKLLIVGRE
jgi:biotin carboxyl carrier protein